ncbi:unnamed protein product [Trichobilharzia regenti]|nr:unnamed protein product [Trichobilharzia regenti]
MGAIEANGDMESQSCKSSVQSTSLVDSTKLNNSEHIPYPLSVSILLYFPRLEQSQNKNVS